MSLGARLRRFDPAAIRESNRADLSPVAQVHQARRRAAELGLTLHTEAVGTGNRALIGSTTRIKATLDPMAAASREAERSRS